MTAKKTLAVLILILVAGALRAQQTQYVIIAVIDGARYSETFGDASHQWIPRIWNTLRPSGAIYTSYFNNGATETCQGHSSIMTGTWQMIANDGSERPHAPTMFEYYRQQRGFTADQNHVDLGKTKLSILAYSDYAGYGAAYGATVKYSSSELSDQYAWDNVKNSLQTSHPRLTIVNLPATDAAGHAGVWNSYVSALRNADSLVYQIWNLVQNDPVMAGKTTLFVTNDHGRHLDGVNGGFSSHGDGCLGCRHILLLAIGPDTPAGLADTTTRQQIDIAPTVGNLLGFSTPYATGQAISWSGLPIQLSYLTGTVLPNAGGVDLRWGTLSETNNYGFIVQRRRDAEERFKDVPGSFRAGHGTTIIPQSYEYCDSAVTTGRWHYRLAQIDLDGSAHYTDPVIVDLLTTVPAVRPAGFELLQNYPNPFNPTTVVSFQLPAVSNVRLAVYDLVGREVAVLVNEQRAPGSYEVTFDGTILSSGVYVYRLEAGTTVQSRTMMLLR
jgi:hypothetical protein